MKYRNRIEEFLEGHPATASEPIHVSITAIFMAFTLPALVYFIYPHFENESLKTILNGALSPIVLFLSWFGSGLILCSTNKFQSRLFLFALFLPLLAWLSMKLHLHWVMHYLPNSIERFLVLFLGAALGSLIALFNLRISRQ